MYFNLLLLNVFYLLLISIIFSFNNLFNDFIINIPIENISDYILTIFYLFSYVK